MVVSSYAIANPKTMMVISFNANIALSAMSCAIFADYLANPTVKSLGLDRI